MNAAQARSRAFPLVTPSASTPSPTGTAPNRAALCLSA